MFTVYVNLKWKSITLLDKWTNTCTYVGNCIFLLFLTDTLSVLARTVGDMFRPLASQCLQIAIKLLTDGTDPDLRRCV